MRLTLNVFFSSHSQQQNINQKFSQQVNNYWSEVRTLDMENLWKKNNIECQILFNNSYLTILKKNHLHPEKLGTTWDVVF